MRLKLAATILGIGAAVSACGVVEPSSTPAKNFDVGDCLQVGGAVDRPEAHEVPCGSPESNYRVVATVAETDECPPDVDFFYSQRGGISESVSTVCLDVDWVVGGCMSIDPKHVANPMRVDCADRSVPNRQRATQILNDVAAADQCVSGQGYAYSGRQFTVCVEHIR